MVSARRTRNDGIVNPALTRAPLRREFGYLAHNLQADAPFRQHDRGKVQADAEFLEFNRGECTGLIREDYN